MNQLLSMNTVATMWKIQGPKAAAKCLNLLRSIEEKRQVTILTQHGRLYFTTEAQLKSVLPEVFEEDTFTQDTLSSMKEALQILTNRVNTLSVKANECKDTTQDIKHSLKSMREELASLAKPV